MDAPQLPFPEAAKLLDDTRLQGACKLAGILMVAWWFIPWGSGMFSWDAMSSGGGFMALWQLLGGGGLVALGFLPPGKLKVGVMWSIAGGIAGMGLLSVATAGLGVGLASLVSPGFVPLLSLATVSVSLLLWSRLGYRESLWYALLGGLGGMALSMLIPVGGKAPVVLMFQILGASFVPLLVRFIIFVMWAGFVGLGVLALLKIALKKQEAPADWIRLVAWLALLFVPVFQVIGGVLGMFSSIWMLILMLHMLVLTGVYLVGSILVATRLIGARLDGSLKSLFD